MLQSPLENPSELFDVYVDTSGFGWTAGLNGTVYYTADWGQTWEDRSLPTDFGPVLTLAYVPGSNGQRVVVAGEQIAYSTDAGLTWTEVGPPSSLGNLTHSAALSDTAIFLTNDRGVLLRSRDGGATWTEVSLPIEEAWTSLQFVEDTLGWLGSRYGDILRSTDGGQSWTVLHDSTFEGRIELHFFTPDFGYAASGKDFIRTLDGGQTWDTLAQHILTRLVHDLVAIDYLHILATQGPFMAVSHDGGLTWQSDYNHPYVGTSNRGLHAHADGKVWAANKFRSLLYSSDHGDTWQDQFPGFKGFLGKIAAYDAQTVVAAGSGWFIRTQNSGLDWEELTTNLPTDLSAQGLLALSEQDFIIAGANELLSSHDGGLTWTTDTSFSSGLLRDLTRDPQGHVYALQTAVGVLASADSGRSWRVIEGPVNQARGLSWPTDSSGYLASSAGRIFRTLDGGATWDTLTTGASARLERIAWSSAQDVWVLRGGFSDSVLHSADAGATWERIALTRRYSWRSLAFSDSLRGWIVGGRSADGYVLQTTDGGQTWTEVREQPVGIFDLTVPYRADTLMFWACGQGGLVDFYGTVDTTAADTSSNDTTTTSFWQQAAPDFQLYPNPSQGSIAFKTPFASTQPLALQVFDLQGRPVAAYAWPQVPEQVDLSALPAGLYLMRLQQGNRLAVRRWQKE